MGFHAGKQTPEVGRRFGSLTVTGSSEIRINEARFIECKCDCGTKRYTRVLKLLRGATRSCGCSKMRTGASCHTYTHGMTRTAEFKAWSAMMDRCECQTNKDYPEYGARGIRVCGRWKESFKTFLSDMGVRPSPMHSLDRVNNDKGYSPDNCRWATRKQQANNRRGNRIIEAFGEKKTISEWASISEISYACLFERLKTNIEPEIAISRPVRELKTRNRVRSLQK